MKNYQSITNVEQAIVFFFVWREIIGENEWYEEGIKELAKDLERHEKSVTNAIKTLREKKIVTIQKYQNTLWIKHTLTDDELYSRMAFISHMFCYPQSIQELEEDLKKEIVRLDEEIKVTEEVIARKQEENRIIESVINQITDKDIEKLAERIVKHRTYVNVNKSLKEIIRDELAIFRAEMFSKYGGISEEEDFTQVF